MWWWLEMMRWRWIVGGEGVGEVGWWIGGLGLFGFVIGLGRIGVGWLMPSVSGIWSNSTALGVDCRFSAYRCPSTFDHWGCFLDPDGPSNFNSSSEVSV
ncbi:hypothetical protein L195_g002909 [Trifolium pratense]|uniref:Uncharacterized protein n=1 Tax=Trifolium pratense TaxID=57577 RepID=A0A2K3NTU3_TRIPR|nr:hypothetical protein L195_g002909 [Trifolium pratense]